MYRSMSDNTPKSLLPSEDEFYTSPEFNFGSGEPRGWSMDKNESRAHQMEFYKMIFPVVKTPDDNIAFFNFAADSIELMNGNGVRINSVPIKFHLKAKVKTNTKKTIKLSDSDWRWGSEILTDQHSREIYTIFLKSGLVKIQRVNLQVERSCLSPSPKKSKSTKGTHIFS